MRRVKSILSLLFLGLAATGCSSSPTMQTSTPAGSAASNAKAPNENAALDATRKTAEAQATYFKINRRYALTFDELIEAHFLNAEPTAAQTGYDFKLRPAADAQTYKLSVVPADANASSARRFFLDQSGVLRSETGKEATADSPELK
jgi:hypothetical protein